MLRRHTLHGCLLLLVATACSPTTDDRSSVATQETPLPRSGGRVVIGVISDLDSFNPYLTETDFGADLLAQLYPSLAIEQPDYAEHPPTFAPALASSWEHSADNLSITFYLRDDLVWSDGAGVTAADVLFAYQTQTSAELGWTSSYIKDYIASVDALDPYTVRFTFTHQYPYQLMDANDGLIIPAHAWSAIPFERWRETDWRSRQLSAGPFMLADYTSQQEIVLERNPRYFRPGRPLLDQAVWRIVPSQASLLTQLRTGAIDFVNVVPVNEVERVKADPTISLVVAPDRRYTYVGWNTRHALFSARATRRALTMAIDRQAIVDVALAGLGHVSTGPVLSTMWAFDSSLTPLAFDPDQARKLLAQAGFDDTDGDGTIELDGTPFAFELLVTGANQDRLDAAVLIHDNLARLGISVTVTQLDWGAIAARLDEGDFSAFIGSWKEPTQVDLSELWHSPDPQGYTSNWVGYSNAEVDQLLDQVSQLGQASEQKPLLDRIQELIVSDQPYTFLYETYRRSGLSRRVHGAVINDVSPYFNLEDWYVAPEGARR